MKDEDGRHRNQVVSELSNCDPNDESVWIAVHVPTLCVLAVSRKRVPNQPIPHERVECPTCNKAEAEDAKNNEQGLDFTSEASVLAQTLLSHLEAPNDCYDTQKQWKRQDQKGVPNEWTNTFHEIYLSCHRVAATGCIEY